MASVKEIYRYLDSLAPFATQMGFDNAGFLVGRGEQKVEKVLVALDITQTVVREAGELGAQLIVSHHPVIFHPARTITDESVTGKILLGLTEGHIAAICAHTNLDLAERGVNDALARRLELQEIGPFEPVACAGVPGERALGRIGRCGAPRPASDFAAYVKQRLGAQSVRYADGGRPVSRVAVGGGACGDMAPRAAAMGCDALVTSDVKYDQFLEAKALGVTLIDAGHYPTENVVCPVLEGWLREGFPGLGVCRSERHREVYEGL